MVAERELGERRDACEERKERRAPRGFSARGDRVGGGASSAKQEVVVPHVRLPRPRAYWHEVEEGGREVSWARRGTQVSFLFFLFCFLSDICFYFILAPN